MKARDIYDEITGKCECGCKMLFVYDAKITGAVEFFNKTQFGIKKLPKEDQMTEYLIVCTNCRKVAVSKHVDAVHNFSLQTGESKCML
jgi:hypothetical protein